MEENNGNKHLIFTSIDDNIKKVSMKKIARKSNLIQTII